MATVINGILNQRLPWRLVLMGVALVIAVEILGVRSLAFATWIVSFHCHHGRDVCRRPRPSTSRSDHGEKDDSEASPARSIPAV